MFLLPVDIELSLLSVWQALLSLTTLRLHFPLWDPLDFFRLLLLTESWLSAEETHHSPTLGALGPAESSE